MRGFLVLDKPAGPTSHDLVGILRSLIGVKRVGHTGTLDPFATGVLPLAIGPATRLISFLDEASKGYEADLTLGQATETGDLEGTVVETGPIVEVTGFDAVASDFVGELTQRAPPYSAVKVDGKPLYKYAREGDLRWGPERSIQVSAIERLPCETPGCLRFSVQCSRGTYVRVLGMDIAKAMGTVGHLSALRRTHSGAFHIKQALGIEDLAEAATGSRDWRKAFARDRNERLPRVPREEIRAFIQQHLVGIQEAFSGWEVQECSEGEARRVRDGISPPSKLPVGTRLLLMRQGEVLALGERQLHKGGVRTRLLRVLPPLTPEP